MAAIGVKSFNGLKPIVSTKLLQNNEAQTANNVRLVSGALVPMKASTDLKDALRTNPKTIFPYQGTSGENSTWLEFAEDTDVFRSPIANDVNERLYWTNGTDVPRYAPYSLILQSGTGAYPRASYQLGIPAPTSPPSITSFGNPTAYTRVARDYVLTFYNPTTLKESFPTKVLSIQGVDGQKVSFSNLTTDNLGDAGITKKRIYRKVSGTFRRITELDLNVSAYNDTATDASIASASAIWNSLSLSGPTRAPSVSNIGSVSSETSGAMQRVYMVSFADASGNETSHGPASATVWAVDGTTDVTVTHSETMPAGVTKKRLYRQTPTITGAVVSISESAWKLVAETTASTTSFSDKIADSALGASLSMSLQSLPSTPTGTPGAIATVPSDTVPETRTYVYTYVSAYGEEGPPSAASSSANIDPEGDVTISIPASVPTGSYNITKKRIYRSSTVGNAAQFQYVDEVPVASDSYTDSKTQSDLGEVLPSEDWVAPPAGLKGMRVMANGAAVGFVGKTLYLSEPNLPHAWPHEYPIDFNIVGIATFGQSVAVLTDSYPYLFQGIDPAAMSSSKLPLQQACVSKRSIVETGSGVIYASADGLVEIGTTNDVVTKNLYSRDQWQSFSPSSMECYVYNGRIHITYDTGSLKGMLVVDISGQGAALTTSDINASSKITAGYYDARSDILYLAQGGKIKRFDAGAPLTSKWRSKVFRLDYPTNFGFCQVVAEAYPVTIRVYCESALKLQKVVQNNNAFRLPSGFRSYDWEFELETGNEVYSVSIAQNSTEMKAL